MITVFVPSSPTSVTGDVVTVPRRDVIELGLSLDEARRYVISGGVIAPDREMVNQPVEGLPARE